MNIDRALIRDIGILIGRIGIGVILFAHGWQKVFDWGLPMTAEIMGGAGVPLPTLSAYFTGFAELIGGAALIVGVAVPLAAASGIFIMTGAFIYAQNSSTIFMDDNGFGFVLSIAVACTMLVAAGSGRFGLDHYLPWRFIKEESQVKQLV